MLPCVQSSSGIVTGQKMYLDPVEFSNVTFLIGWFITEAISCMSKSGMGMLGRFILDFLAISLQRKKNIVAVTLCLFEFPFNLFISQMPNWMPVDTQNSVACFDSKVLVFGAYTDSKSKGL